MSLIAQVLGKQKKVQFIQQDKTVITIECTIDETHAKESTPTSFPVENGTTVNDHIIQKPFSLTLHGIITDTPLSFTKSSAITTGVSAAIPSTLGVIGTAAGAAAGALFSALTGGGSLSGAAYKQLVSLQAAGQPFDVVTTLNRYSNMWISSLSAPRSAQTGNALEFTLQLVQLLLVTPLTVQIQIFQNGDLSAAEQDQGNQQMNNALLDQVKKGQAAAHAATGL
jgi:hypothetical protein